MIDYLATFIIIFLENIAPAFTPPTWMILGFIYNLNKMLDPLILAFIGAVASTMGRFVLANISTRFKNRFVEKKRAKKMLEIGKIAKENPVKAFLVMVGLSSFAPFPSNALFIIIGFSEASTIPVFAGFFVGRFIQYFVMILTTNLVLTSIADIFALSWQTIVLLDAVTLVFVILFSMIDWVEFFHTRKLKLSPIRFRNNSNNSKKNTTRVTKQKKTKK